MKNVKYALETDCVDRTICITIVPFDELDYPGSTEALEHLGIVWHLAKLCHPEPMSELPPNIVWQCQEIAF